MTDLLLTSVLHSPAHGPVHGPVHGLVLELELELELVFMDESITVYCLYEYRIRKRSTT